MAEIDIYFTQHLLNIQNKLLLNIQNKCKNTLYYWQI